MEVSVIYCKLHGNRMWPYVGRFRGSLKAWNQYQHMSGGGVAKQYKLPVVLTQVLEDTSCLTLKEHCAREVFWINYFADMYGISPRAKLLAHDKSWTAQFKVGVLLNTHALDGSAACDAAARKIRESGKSAAQRAQQYEALKALHITRVTTARRCVCSDGFIGNQPELVEHLQLSRGTVSAGMSQAFRSGSHRFSNNITIRPYDSN